MRRLVPGGAVLVVLVVAVLASKGQQQAGPGDSRASLSPWYKVEPDWPQRPPEASWAAMPGIAVDKQDRIWIFTRATPPVQVYDRTGKFLDGWGEKTVKTAHHIKIGPEGNVWLSDIGLHVIRKFSPKGRLLLTLGTVGQPGNDQTHFDKPTDMAITPAGDVFVSDGYGNQRVVHFDRNGRFVKQWGKLGTGPGEFRVPHAIALDSRGRLYVADREGGRVQVFDQSGKFLDEWRNLIVPWGLWVSPSDEIWVCGSSPMSWGPHGKLQLTPPKDQVFMKFDTTGRLLQLWTVPKAEDGKEQPGECNWLHAIALDSKGDIYVGDIMGKRAQKFSLQK